MKKPPGGVYCVLPTPLGADGSVDQKAMKSITTGLLSKGIRGLVVLGSGGELPYLSPDEKKYAMDAVAEAADGKTPVIAGAGAFGTDETIEIARHAENLGFDALLAPLPIYFSLKFNSVLTHYRRLADAVSTPIIYYHFPEVTRLDLTAKELAKLFEIESVIGIKESIFNLRTVKEHIAAIGNDAMVFSGTTLLMRPVMRMGGCGCICPIQNLIPETCLAFYEALRDGRRSEARELEKKVFAMLPVFADAPLPTEILRRAILTSGELGAPLKMGGSSHASVKEAMRLLGHPLAARVKSPLPALSDKDANRVKRALAAAGLINVKRK